MTDQECGETCATFCKRGTGGPARTLSVALERLASSYRAISCAIHSYMVSAFYSFELSYAIPFSECHSRHAYETVEPHETLVSKGCVQYYISRLHILSFPMSSLTLQ